MKRSLDRNGNSSPRKRFRDVVRLSESGSERQEGGQRVGRNTTPKEDWHDTTHRAKRSDRNEYDSSAGDRGGGVERTSEWERSGRRWEGDRVDRDREGKLAIGSERDRESREEQQEGRNTMPTENRNEYDSSARDRDQKRTKRDRYTGQRPFRDEEIRKHIAPRRQQKGTITPQHRQLQQQICSCQSLLQLLETVDRAEDMNYVNVSTAIHRSAKHVKREANCGRTLLDDRRFQRSFDIQYVRHVCPMYSPM